MRINLFVRITTVIFAILLIAISLTGILDYYKFRNFYVDLVRDRLSLVLTDIRRTVETSIAFGLPINELQGVNEAMRKRVNRDSNILSIEFFDHDGIVLYAVDQSLIGDLVSEEWTSNETIQQEVWGRVEADAVVVGVNVQDALGQPIGILALRYGRDVFNREIREMGLRILGICAGIIALFAAIGTFAAFFVVRELRQHLVTMRDSLDEEGVSQEGGGEQGKMVLEKRFLRSVDAANTSITNTVKKIHDMEEEITPGRVSEEGKDA